MMHLLYQLAITADELGIPQAKPGQALPNILRIVFATAGAVSVLVLTIAGLRLVFSMGDPQGLTRARNTVIYAAIGLVVCITGFTIVSFVISRF